MSSAFSNVPSVNGVFSTPDREPERAETKNWIYFFWAVLMCIWKLFIAYLQMNK